MQKKPSVILLVSGACCLPGMESLDVAAQEILLDALKPWGLTADDIHQVSATDAWFSGLLAPYLPQITDCAAREEPPFPLIIVDGTLVSYGVPEAATVRAYFQKKECL